MTLGSHQQTVGKSQNHITPLWMINALGGAQSFDLDPAGADPRPWDCAKVTWTSRGLELIWFGFVWLNPPFDVREVGLWIAKLAAHGNGIALLHARTEAAWFDPIWERASGILFLNNRIKFCKPDGSEQPFNSGAPAILVAFGSEALARLRRCGIPGKLVTVLGGRSSARTVSGGGGRVVRILGVDPGVRGGLALVEINDGAAPALLEAIDIPTIGVGAKERVDPLALRTWVVARQPQHAFIERAQAMPKQGASSGFKYGRATGSIEAVIACCEIAITIVEPAVWKKAHHLRGGDKEGARQRALELFPSAHALLARKKDHGRAEAALIALHGVRP